MKIETYSGKYDDEIISLILNIQNKEAGIGLSLEEQPDLLDTPSVAHASHKFYERAGFHRIDTTDLPIAYSYPDRDSFLYMLDLE